MKTTFTLQEVIQYILGFAKIYEKKVICRKEIKMTIQL